MSVLEVCNLLLLPPRASAEFPMLSPLGVAVDGLPGEVVESQIDGLFRGWCGRTVFRLRNGQVWQQADFGCLYRYSYAPRVRVYQTAGGYAMQVQGVPKPTPVRRVR